LVGADKQVTLTDNLTDQIEFPGKNDYQIISQK